MHLFAVLIIFQTQLKFNNRLQTMHRYNSQGVRQLEASSQERMMATKYVLSSQRLDSPPYNLDPAVSY